MKKLSRRSLVVPLSADQFKELPTVWPVLLVPAVVLPQKVRHDSCTDAQNRVDCSVRGGRVGSMSVTSVACVCLSKETRPPLAHLPIRYRGM